MKWTRHDDGTLAVDGYCTTIKLYESRYSDELLADANLGAEARAAAGHYPGTPAELIEQLRRELDAALRREEIERKRAEAAEKAAKEFEELFHEEAERAEDAY